MAGSATTRVCSPGGWLSYVDMPTGALTSRESVGRALCVTNLRDDATSWGMYLAKLGDRASGQDHTMINTVLDHRHT
jgi:hypothetical protein